MKSQSFALLGQVHRWLSRSDWLVAAIVKVENQCKAIIRARLNDGIDPERNGEYLLLSHVAPDAGVFIDVGANVGNWARTFSTLMKRPGLGLLVEPSPHAIAELKRRVPDLSCETEIVEAAAGDVQREAVFFAEPDSGETSSLIEGFSSRDARAITVSVTTIDHEVSSHRIEFVDFLKIDAEGFDLKVLMGAKETLRKTHIGIVQFEYNAPWAQTGSTLAEAMQILRAFGYEVFLLKRNGLYRIRYERYGEYFGYSNYVAVSQRSREKVSSLVRGTV